MIYFAQDGSFGSADGLVVLDVSEWTNDDWESIELCSDDDRVRVALEVARSHGRGGAA